MTQKEKAIECMQTLDIYKRYINAFKAKKQRVCFFERYGGFYAEQEPELQKKIEEHEKRTGDIVYAVTHEMTDFGECYDFLVVSKYEEDWEYSVEETIENNVFCVFAYVWNVTDNVCSEYGTISVHSFGGGIKRIA